MEARQLMECLREQPSRLARMPQRVTEAACLADQHAFNDAQRGRVLHFFGIDPARPEYPEGPDERRALLRGR